MTFKAGDIVVCLRNSPYGADIRKGGRAVVVRVEEEGIRFYNLPRNPHQVNLWVADVKDFKLARRFQLENK